MIYYVMASLIVMATMAVLGFGGVAGAAMDTAKILFYVFVATMTVSLLAGRRQRVRG